MSHLMERVPPRACLGSLTSNRKADLRVTNWRFITESSSSRVSKTFFASLVVVHSGWTAYVQTRIG